MKLTTFMVKCNRTGDVREYFVTVLAADEASARRAAEYSLLAGSGIKATAIRAQAVPA